MIVPAALTREVADAPTVATPVLNISFVNEIVGLSTYPPPAFVIVTTPTIPSPIVAVAAAPTPLPSVVLNVTDGATVYPEPGLTTLTA